MKKQNQDMVSKHNDELQELQSSLMQMLRSEQQKNTELEQRIAKTIQEKAETEE